MTAHVGGCLCHACIVERQRGRVTFRDWSGIDLPTPVRNALIRNGLRPDDARAMSDAQLLRHRHIGRGAVACVREALARPPAWTVIA